MLVESVVYCMAIVTVWSRLAPECLTTTDSFTSSSDVWSFAVLLWEMFSGGSHPWPGMSGDQVSLSLLYLDDYTSIDEIENFVTAKVRCRTCAKFT